MLLYIICVSQEELLKRRAYEKPAEKGTQPFKVPVLVNTRVTQAYPIIKPVDRCKQFYLKEGVKVLTIIFFSWLLFIVSYFVFCVFFWYKTHYIFPLLLTRYMNYVIAKNTRKNV